MNIIDKYNKCSMDKKAKLAFEQSIMKMGVVMSTLKQQSINNTLNSMGVR